MAKLGRQTGPSAELEIQRSRSRSYKGPRAQGLPASMHLLWPHYISSRPIPPLFQKPEDGTNSSSPLVSLLHAEATALFADVNSTGSRSIAQGSAFHNLILHLKYQELHLSLHQEEHRLFRQEDRVQPCDASTVTRARLIMDLTVFIGQRNDQSEDAGPYADAAHFEQGWVSHGGLNDGEPPVPCPLLKDVCLHCLLEIDLRTLPCTYVLLLGLCQNVVV